MTQFRTVQQYNCTSNTCLGSAKASFQIKKKVCSCFITDKKSFAVVFKPCDLHNRIK